MERRWWRLRWRHLSWRDLLREGGTGALFAVLTIFLFLFSLRSTLVAAVKAAGVHLGCRALALAALLNKHFKLTSWTTCVFLKTLAGLKISPGGLVQAMHRMAEKCHGAFESLIGELRAEPAVNADETSWWVSGAGWWLWVFTSPRTTLFRIDQSRGRNVVLDVLGEGFAGVLGSDCLATYENLPYRMQKCYSHHLKAIAHRAGMKGIQEWLSFYYKSPMAAPGLQPEHDLFIQQTKLKNTLRHLMGEEQITHLGLEYYQS